MRTIWKFKLHLLAPTSIITPRGAKFLHGGPQFDALMAWYEVDDSAPMEQRVITPIGTGHFVPTPNDYLFTQLCNDGTLVLHYYEELL